jgi:hypothetical protein
VLARTVAEIEQAKATGRLALVAGLEAATMVEKELDRLDILYGFGVRQVRSPEWKMSMAMPSLFIRVTARRPKWVSPPSVSSARPLPSWLATEYAMPI